VGIVHLYVSVPVACFRVAQAREYWETYSCPPPATVYGMLLSLVGEQDRLVHQGAEVALAAISEPQRSVVLRTLWRIKSMKTPLGLGSNKRPDFQEILTDIRLSVCVRPGAGEQAPEKLATRLLKAFESRGAGVRRFGGLSLGESTHLVNDVRQWREGDPTVGRFLVADDHGDLSLPIWPDHVGSRGTSWGQFTLRPRESIGAALPQSGWTAILPPESGP
jgi:CRISPR-associated protein Cas5t